MSRFTQYIKDTRSEMKHVSWPTRSQTIAFTVLVVVLSIFVAIYLGVFDFVFAKGLEVTLENARGLQGTSANPVLDVDVASSSATSSDITITPIPTE